MRTNSSNRWLIAAAGVVMQVALGVVHTWSVFRIPPTKSYGWTVSQVTLAFELAILMLGFASFAGGLWMKRAGLAGTLPWLACATGRGSFSLGRSGATWGCSALLTACWVALLDLFGLHRPVPH